MQPSNQTPSKTTQSPTHRHLAALRDRWTTAWAKDGFLHNRWEDIRQVRDRDWHAIATWLKTTFLVLGIAGAIILLHTASVILGEALHKLSTSTHLTRGGTALLTDLWGVIDTPAHAYITDHSAGLTTSGPGIYFLWQITGFTGFLGGLLGFTAARLTWVIWGALTLMAVWLATPTTSRPLALAIALTAWSLASLLALRGLTLRVRPLIYNAPPQPRIEVRPEIHLPTPANATPDNVRPLQR
ncbi:hypothetical protein ACFC0K_36350 [Streptomyces hydrogenans]|uniref:hypothetical protein n=1 Tax=Streptomyces hydrogenans TaxID=1873719 RepID=UPI0035DAFABC